LTAYLELADYLLIAEAVRGVPAELIADFNRIGLPARRGSGAGHRRPSSGAAV
jgi:hypothetical protein